MAGPDVPNNIILYWYRFSPYGRRVAWYLQLRGIAFAECLQPMVLPRPDLRALNVDYRRIPLLSVGRDIYCDTRLIIRKLEAQFPDNALGSTDATSMALERLLERWTVDGGVFARAASLIPPEMPVWKDEKFAKDRDDFVGAKGAYNLERVKRGRPESLVHIRDAFELLETTLLADGRSWIFKTDKPSLGDIEAIWPFHWLVEMKGALPPAIISENQFPKVFGWINRFRDAVGEARRRGPKTITLTGAQVVEYMSRAHFQETVGEFDANDPLELHPLDEVDVWPIDSGSAHRDRGKLVSLTPHEVVIAKWMAANDRAIHLHMPRWGFRIARVGDGGGGKL